MGERERGSVRVLDGRHKSWRAPDPPRRPRPRTSRPHRPHDISLCDQLYWQDHVLVPARGRSPLLPRDWEPIPRDATITAASPAGSPPPLSDKATPSDGSNWARLVVRPSTKAIRSDRTQPTTTLSRIGCSPTGPYYGGVRDSNHCALIPAHGGVDLLSEGIPSPHSQHQQEKTCVQRSSSA